MTGDIKEKSNLDLYKNYFSNIKIEDGRVKVYSDLEKEYDALRHGIAIRDISASSMLRLTGTDVLDYLHRVSTNSVKDLETLNFAETLFTNEKGRLINKTVLLNLENYKLLIGSEAEKEALWYWIEKYIIMEDIKTQDAGSDYNLFEILGPQKESYMTLLCGSNCEEASGSIIMPRVVEDFEFYLLKINDVNGIEKYWILVKNFHTEKFLKYLSSHESVFDVKMVGEEAYEIFRVENGIPKAPNEINDSFNPYEVNLIDKVSFTKGCYIGQEVIARLDTYEKVQKYLTGVVFENDEEIKTPTDLFSKDGADAGKITSSVLSKIIKKKIGLAVVKKQYLEEGTKLTAKTLDGNKLNVKIVKLPVRR